MENGQLTWITNFIWGIADDVLRDLYVRGKYRYNYPGSDR
jgi:type I restriction enzyme M protein